MQEEYNVAATQTCDVYTVCSMFDNLCITMISVKERVSTYILMLTRTVTPHHFYRSPTRKSESESGSLLATLSSAPTPTPRSPLTFLSII